MCAPGQTGHNPRTGFCWDSRAKNGWHCETCCKPKSLIRDEPK